MIHDSNWRTLTRLQKPQMCLFMANIQYYIKKIVPFALQKWPWLTMPLGTFADILIALLFLWAFRLFFSLLMLLLVLGLISKFLNIYLCMFVEHNFELMYTMYNSTKFPNDFHTFERILFVVHIIHLFVGIDNTNFTVGYHTTQF